MSQSRKLEADWGMIVLVTLALVSTAWLFGFIGRHEWRRAQGDMGEMAVCLIVGAIISFCLAVLTLGIAQEAARAVLGMTEEETTWQVRGKVERAGP